jgi:parallel beta-helix repeat protein
MRRWYWLVALLAAVSLGGAILVTAPGNEHRHDVLPKPADRLRPHPSPASVCVGITLTVASNVQNAINNAPSGTTFCFSPGIYHVSSLVPKSGDVLDGGKQKAVLDGNNSARYAVYGDSTSPGPSDVTIKGFVIEHFKTPLQRGAIQDYNGPGWIIQNNHITRNAAAGVATGDNVRVLNNLIDHNAQEGFSAGGNGGLYQGNEIAYNNFNLAINPTWEAGGGKAWATQHLTFKSNYVHDNGGPGLWADTNNIYTTLDSNTVDNNWGPGIYYEISYDAIITNNTVTDNGMPSSPGGGQRNGWAWDAGIQLRESGALNASSPLIISHNTVTNNYNGITLIQSPASGCTGEGEGKYGPCNVQNVLVKDNVIIMSRGSTGEFQDGAENGIFTAQHNIFQDNHYCVTSIVHPYDGYADGWLTTMNSDVTWAQWRDHGLDRGGTFTISEKCSLRSGDLTFPVTMQPGMQIQW